MKFLVTFICMIQFALASNLNFCEKIFNTPDINDNYLTIKCIAGLTYISQKNNTYKDSGSKLVPTYQECECQRNGNIKVEPIYDENASVERYLFVF